MRMVNALNLCTETMMHQKDGPMRVSCLAIDGYSFEPLIHLRIKTLFLFSVLYESEKKSSLYSQH